MSGKLVLGGLVAVAVMALSATPASAQRGGWYGGHHRPAAHPGYRPAVHPGYRPAYTFPVYQPVFASPYYQPLYTAPVYGSPYYGTPYFGSSFNTVNFGVYRPGFGLNLGFVIR